MRYYRATIAYDGTDFLGFQIQARGRTIQGTLEQTLAKIAKKPVRIVGAGRTDTGVHASGQVIGFALDWRHASSTLQTALNVILPSDIAVVEVAETTEEFHPRFSAVSRQYRYTVLNQATRDVFKNRYSMFVSKPLDLSAMQRASGYLLGEHDFAAFGRPPQGDNTVRTVLQAEWSKQGLEYFFEITANAFLYRMVRNIVGTLLEVGTGNLTSEAVSRILASKERSQAAPPVLPNGLCLVKVNYV